MTSPKILCALIFGAAAVGCAPPKVLVGHSYATSDKSIHTIIQKSGASAPSGSDKSGLFDVYMRVCDQDASNTMSDCKDTLILSNVNPDSI